MLPDWAWRLRNLLRVKKAAAGRTEELQFHFDMEVEAGLRRGLDETEARRQATLRAGRISQGLESTREEAGFRWFDSLWMNLRHAGRALRRKPGFASIAILVLTASVAMNTLIFFMLEGVVLRPLPYSSPEGLIRIYDGGKTEPKFPVAIGHFLEYRKHAASLDGIALYTGRDMEFGAPDGRPERLTGVQITSDFFKLLGMSPAAGRAFADADLRDESRSVVISHRLWTNRFQSDPSIVGQVIRLNRMPWTVIGVAPRGFQHVGGDYRSPVQGETVDLWLPLALDIPDQGLNNWHYCNAVARTRAGFQQSQVREELNRLMAGHRQRFPNSGDWNARIEPLLGEVTGRSREVVWLLALAGGLVLLIACANIAGLCIARSLARQQELALRQALGANRWQLIHVGLAENLIMGLVSSALGIAAAAAGLRILHQLLPADFPRSHEISLTLSSACFAVAVALASAIAAGLFPSMKFLSAMHSAPRSTASRDSRHTRTALVAGEIALAGLLAASALFLLRSYVEVGSRNHGFNAKDALVFQLTVPFNVYREKAPIVVEDVRRKILMTPGVVSAGATTNLPWSGYDENTSFGIPGRLPEDSKDSPSARFQAATPGYFEAAGMQLISGRFFETGRDEADQPPSVIVNDALAKRYFRGEDAAGQMIDVFGKKRRIAGVVVGIRDFPADLSVKPALWFSNAQQPFLRVFFAVRVLAGQDPAKYAAAVTEAVHAVDSELPVADLRTLERHSEGAMAGARLALWLFETFAALGLLLAAAGIYGLLAYLVQQRRKEFGIRAAMGASRSMLWRMIVADSLKISAAGSALCAVLIPVAGKLLKALLYNVTAFDLWTIVGAIASLMAISLAASLSPAWTAMRCDPASALRDE